MDKVKLAALLQETESDFAYEVVKACKAANALIKAHGLTWAELLADAPPKPEKARGEAPSAPDYSKAARFDLFPALTVCDICGNTWATHFGWFCSSQGVGPRFWPDGVPRPEKTETPKAETPKGGTPKYARFSEDELGVWRSRIRVLQENGPGKYRGFFDSMATALERYGSLSPKQQSAILKFRPGA